MPGYRYSSYVTNLDLPLDVIWNMYNGRTDCENRIKELKQDFGLEKRLYHILCKWQNSYLINGFSRLSNIMENCEKMKDQSLIGIVHFLAISL